MGMTAPKNGGGGGGDWENPEPGTYVGRCVKVIDLGTQADNYNNEPKMRRKIFLGWELGGALMKEGDFAGQPMVVGKKYSFSMYANSQLRKLIQSWFGRIMTDEQADNFDFSKLLGINGLLQLVPGKKEGQIYIDTIMKRPESMPAYPQVNKSVMFSLEPTLFQPEMYINLPKYFKELVTSSPEFAKVAGKLPKAGTGPGGTAAGGVNEADDIPF